MYYGMVIGVYIYIFRLDKKVIVFFCSICVTHCIGCLVRLILGKRRPLITGSEKHTVYIKNSIRFSYFGDIYHRNNLPHGICRYDFQDRATWLCNIFKLGERQYLGVY